MEYQEQLQMLNLSIEQMKEEKRRFIVENHKPEILLTINQLYFQQEDLQEKTQQVSEIMEDTRCLLRTMRQFTEEDALERMRDEYQWNCKKIEDLLKNQTRLLNNYLNQVNTYLNK